MCDDSVLRAKALELMKAGKLPEQRPQCMWGGPGSGESCAVCGKTIGTEEVEMELQFASENGTASYRVHAQCFAAWERERSKGRSNDPSLPKEGNGGMISGRERNTTNQWERG